MHKNLIWQAFLLFVFAITIWHTCIATYCYYIYSHLNTSQNATQIDWNVLEKKEDAYILEAHYSFHVKKEKFSGRTQFDNRIYINRWGAEKAAAELSQLPMGVWYDSSDPERSTLNKSFPIKEILYSIILWGLFLYFLWLSLYVKRFKKSY